MSVDHMRAHSGISYQRAYSYLYNRPENQALREKIKAEHMAQTMRGVGLSGAGARTGAAVPQSRAGKLICGFAE
jgi:hypothetical protein